MRTTPRSARLQVHPQPQQALPSQPRGPASPVAGPTEKTSRDAAHGRQRKQRRGQGQEEYEEGVWPFVSEGSNRRGTEENVSKNAWLPRTPGRRTFRTARAGHGRPRLLPSVLHRPSTRPGSDLRNESARAGERWVEPSPGHGLESMWNRRGKTSMSAARTSFAEATASSRTAPDPLSSARHCPPSRATADAPARESLRRAA